MKLSSLFTHKDHPSKLFIVLFIIGICLCVHNPALDGDFMMDDSMYLTDEFSYTSLTFTDLFLSIRSRHYAPLNYGLNVLLFRAFPASPFIMHLVNLIFLGLSTLVLYNFLLKLTRRHMLAWITALLYLLHPITADTMGMVFMNTILLMNLLLFCSLSLLCDYLLSKRSFAYIISLAVFFLTLFLQELAIVTSPVIFFMTWLCFKKSFRDSVIITAPYALATCVFLMLWLHFSGETAGILSKFQDLPVSLLAYCAFFMQTISWYLQTIFLIKEPVFIYNIPMTAAHLSWFWLGAVPLFFFGSLYAAVRWIKTPTALFGLIWFLIGFILAVPGSLAHNYMGIVIEPYWFFFTFVGFLLFLSEAFLVIIRNRTIQWKVITSLTILVLLISTSVKLHYVGRYAKRYAEHWLAQCPDNVIALMTLGSRLNELGEPELAIEAYEKAGVIQPHSVIDRSLSAIYLNMEDYDKALFYAQKALDTGDRIADAHNSFGLVYWKMGKFIEAENHFRKALDIDGNYLIAETNLADMLLETGHYPQAREVYEDILKRFPYFLRKEDTIRILNEIKGRTP